MTDQLPLPTPKWMLAHYRSGPSVYFGPFDTLEGALAYAQENGVSPYPIALHPPVPRDQIDWSGERLLAASERSLQMPQTAMPEDVTGRHRDAYALACKRAATQQGLDPVMDALSRAGVKHQLEQTGGMTMVVTVSYPDGTLGITQDGDQYLVVDYPGNAWQESGEEGFVTAMGTVQAVASWASFMAEGKYQ